MNCLRFVVLATGLLCLSVVSQTIANQCVVRKLTLQPGLVANMSVGYPEQYFNVLFNTGSSNTWLASINMTNQYCSSRKCYWSSRSNTHLEDGRYWRSTLGMGVIVEGLLSQDTLGLGGAFVADQPFGEITHSQGWVVEFLPFDGVLGLGSRFSPVVIAMDPIQNMYRQRLIPNQIFSLYVTTNDHDEVVGTAVLGGTDEDYFKGEIIYVPIINRWTFLIDYITLPNSDLKQSIKSEASIDSTMNIFMAPEPIVELVKSLFNISDEPNTKMARWNSCDDVPMDDISITLVIGGTNMTLSAEDLVIKLGPRGQHICYLALQAHLDNSWVLGTQFLRKYYTVFDYDHEQVGFATSA